MNIALNNKLIIKVLPVVTGGLFSEDVGNLRKGEVTSVGAEVEYVKVGDIVTLPIQDITFIESNIGVCSFRNIIFYNNMPLHNKLEIKIIEEPAIGECVIGEVVKSNPNSNELKIGDKIKFKKGKYSILPNHNVLIDENKLLIKIG